VGIEVDNGAEIIVPVDAFGRFRYQVPAESPLPPGPHFVTVHAHNEEGASGVDECRVSNHNAATTHDALPPQSNDECTSVAQTMSAMLSAYTVVR